MTDHRPDPKLEIDIRGLKSIARLRIDLPLRRGLYAIAGQNGAGKSTLLAAVATVFFRTRYERYFGKPTVPDAGIEARYGAETYALRADGRIWRTKGGIQIKGFYEGSLIYGNRFKENNFDTLGKLAAVDPADFVDSSAFVREQLGQILHGDRERYPQLFTLAEEVSSRKYGFKAPPYFHRRNGELIGKAQMSTGENLLITLLHSIDLRIRDRGDVNKPCIFLLDEIEFALHPASLVRLIALLRKVSVEHNMAIYFGTHSVELIREAGPQNTFFLERMADDSIEVVHPCYPFYATKIVYDHIGYDSVLLVEDDLGKRMADRMLTRLRLRDNKLVHVMPCGDWQNVIRLLDDMTTHALLGRPVQVLAVLDRDVQADVPRYAAARFGQSILGQIEFLPVSSLEKFLKARLADRIDTAFHRRLNDYLLPKLVLSDLVRDYRRDFADGDLSGKVLFGRIERALELHGRTRGDLVELVVDYLIEHDEDSVAATTAFLRARLGGAPLG
jgi:ABC-type iron transport system FetAB ATPase subunit